MFRFVAVVCALVAVAAGPVVGTGATIQITLEHPDTLSPSIITGTDSSGEYRIERVGPHTFKLVNFDASVQFILSPNSALAAPSLTACNMGGLGDEGLGPWPLLELTWTHPDLATTSLSLDVDQCSTCDGCDASMEWAE